MNEQKITEKRLDILLFEKGLVKSRKMATDLIKDGKVIVNDEIITKPSKLFSPDIQIDITDMPKYVSRAGQKLEAIIDKFQIKIGGKVVLDVGSSTGGFTDCVLQKGAKKVYAVDVGHGQLSEVLKNNDRIVSLEKTDIRNLKDLSDQIDLAVVDVSFISLEKVLPSILKFLKKNSELIVLVKPQFEVGKENLNKQGIVKNMSAVESAINKIKDLAKVLRLKIIGEMESPIKGGDGNTEYLIYFSS